MTTAPPRPRLFLALGLLTLLSGLVDAACYLGLGRVFTANMTGNVVFLGFGVARASSLPVLAPIVSLGAFVLGAFAAGRLVAAVPDKGRLLRLALAGETVLVGAAAVACIDLPVDTGSDRRYVAIALLAVAFGAQNAVVARLAVAGMTTTVLTGALTGLVAESRLGGGTGRLTGRRVASLLLIFGGALIGALLLRIDLVAPLAAGTAVCVAALIAALRDAA